MLTYIQNAGNLGMMSRAAGHARGLATGLGSRLLGGLIRLNPGTWADLDKQYGSKFPTLREAYRQGLRQAIAGVSKR